MDSTETAVHNSRTCSYCYHENADDENDDASGCWCPDCIYASDGSGPDDFEEAYRAHVRMSGMAPPHADGSPCTCQFGDHPGVLLMDPGSRAERLYEEAHAEYMALMDPVWCEVRTPGWSGSVDPDYTDSMEFFDAVLKFDTRMRTLTKTPPLISGLVREHAYLVARWATVIPGHHDKE